MTTGASASLTRSRAGVLLLLGQGLDSLGYGIATVALPWLVLGAAIGAALLRRP